VKICPVCSTEYADDVRFCPNDGQTLRASSPAHDLVGQVVADRYHVLKKLGEGGMGQVYLAEHVKMGRKSAIKVMNPALVHDADAVARFNREAANASRITHPNVCAIYDFGETPEGLIYLAMEFVEGEPLTDLMTRDGALPVRRAVSIFVQVADALQAAHDLGIVHRDLKPDNIMLTRGREGAAVVKVVDFGIAKAVGGGGDDSQKVTKTGLVVGTPEFMSPEQLSGDRLDGRSDLYSLALVLFKMLTGKLPFEATTVQETMIKRLTDDPMTLAAARPDLRFPPGLQGTLDAALARAPTDRYQSAAKFADDVASVVGLERRAGPVTPLPATRAGTQEKTQLLDAARTKKRSLVPIIAGAAVVLGGAGAAVTMLGGGRKTDDTVRPDTTKYVHGTGLDPKAAGAVLDRLIDRPTNVITDSALVVYNTPGVKVKDRAFAACLLAQAYSTEKESAKARQWARRGLQLDSGLTSCKQVAQSTGGP
jgi:eukaryotic-like serine/threonine-protein kinase